MSVISPTQVVRGGVAHRREPVRTGRLTDLAQRLDTIPSTVGRSLGLVTPITSAARRSAWRIADLIDDSCAAAPVVTATPDGEMNVTCGSPEETVTFTISGDGKIARVTTTEGDRTRVFDGHALTPRELHALLGFLEPRG